MQEKHVQGHHTKTYRLLLETSLTQTPSMSDRSRQSAEKTTKQKRLERTASMYHRHLPFHCGVKAVLPAAGALGKCLGNEGTAFKNG